MCSLLGCGSGDCSWAARDRVPSRGDFEISGRVERVTLRAVALALLLLSACSSGSKHLGAAEPATAPPTAAAPAGTTVTVGDGAEGIVYDPATRLVAVAVRNPDRLLLLDPATLSVRRSVPLPGSARHLQLARPGGPVLVPAESANKIVEVSLPGGASSATDVLKQPHDATAAGVHDVVVGNEFGKSISVLRNGRVLRTVTGLTQPGGVIGTRELVAVVDVGAFTVSTYDLGTYRRIAVAKAGKGPTHGVLVSDNRLVVADTRGNQLLVFGLNPLTELARLPVAGTPYGLAVDRSTDTVWVTLTAENRVAGFDVHRNRPREIASYATVRQPNTVAVAPGGHALWVTGTQGGVVERISR